MQAKNKFSEVKKVLIIILFLNLGVAAAKMWVGMMINSASMFADGVHSVTDGSSNVIGIIGISLAAAPKDTKHPYGHRKIETMTGLFIVVMLVVLSIKIVMDAIPRFANPVTPKINTVSFVVMIITFIVNVVVTKYEHRKGIELKSTILISDAMHTKSDLYVTLGVVVTLVALKLGAPAMIDPIASIIVAGFILKAAFEIFKGASGILIDSAVVDDGKIIEIAMREPEVKNVHNIRSRGAEDDMHIDMHILADPNLPLDEVHELTHTIEKAICDDLECQADVIIHVEPYVSSPVDPSK